MSFFGFDTTLPKDRGHSSAAPGFGQTRDAFAGLGGGIDDDAIDFEDTYDGLGDKLDDADDAFNDDTFGGGPASQQSVGRDFDFAGQTSKFSNTLQEEQMLYQARQPVAQRSPAKRTAKPARSGYESYADPNYIPQLEARADIWGLQPKQPPPPKQQENQVSMATAAIPARKMMSLEEVEAMMRAQSVPGQTPPPAAPQQYSQPPQAPPASAYPQQQASYSQAPPPGFQPGFSGPPQILQRPQQPPAARPASGPQVHAELPSHPARAHAQQQPTILQRQRPQQGEPKTQQQRHATQQPTTQAPPTQPRQILQNPNRLSGQGQPMTQPGQRTGEFQRGPPQGAGHNRGPSFPGNLIVTHPEQLLNLSEEQRAAFLEEDAKRARRNHKIALLSKDNGLMTPQDKNFITRIQLQQLMSATGNLDSQGSEVALNEDFYYQVFSQMRAPRQNPHQPANQFAQTYLFQTSSRYGPGRRHGRGADNHMQRMEQQVQRAVEAAKAKPKGKQLVIEGSLGKIAFSNAKTPRPLLNIKRPENSENKANKKSSIADRKNTLRNIEQVYLTLMQMEDHERNIPPPVNENSDPEQIQRHMEWRSKVEELHGKLWESIKIMEPINPNSQTPHPFIAILSHAKGKKAIPRIFRHIDEQERITVLTMIVVHLDQLPVVSQGIATPEEPLSSATREEIELFSQAVLPPLLAIVSESPLNIIIGLLGLILDRTNVHTVARTKIGLSLLTMLMTRAEILRQSAPETVSDDWKQWTALYNNLFDNVEPVLPILFPGTVNDTDDMYVWQFLATMGCHASPDQQQRLVLGVKDRVMETVSVSKALPPDMASARLNNVNLFMRAIGLDVELLG